MGFVVKIILEMDAMFRGKSLAEEYLANTLLYSKKEMKQISKAYEKITSLGIKMVSSHLLINIIIQVIVFLLVQTIRWR